MQMIAVVLSSWPATPVPTPGRLLLMLSIWFGPAIVSSLLSSWLSGRQGGGVGRGIAVGVVAAVVSGVFGCATPPAMAAAPFVGAAAAVIAVLRS